MDRERPGGASQGDRWEVAGATQGREQAIAALARRQHGVVARCQLLGAGVGVHWIDGRLKAGRLRPMHRGVYLVGPVTPPLARETAAVLACGAGALLSHRSAAALWRLLPYPAEPAPLHVTVPGERRKRPGIRVQHVRSMPRGETSRLNGIPITTPARTLLDLACEVSSRELEQAAGEAVARSLTTRHALLSMLARHPGRSGTFRTRSLLERDGGPALTRSEAERRFLALIRKARLPAPDVNVRVGPHEVDFLWREAGLVVEVDGFAFHSSHAEFETDRRRDAELAANGLNVVRVTWRQIVEEPEAMLVRLARALTRSPER